MKYFFLTQGWTHNRVWERGGLWNDLMWRRKPHIQPLSIGMKENEQVLWLYEVEPAVIMVEVQPTNTSNQTNIGQVVLKRLMDAEQVLETLLKAQELIKSTKNSEYS